MKRFLGEPQPEVEVTLEIVGIRAYGREFKHLEEGMTGAVTLLGEAPPSLGDGWALVG